MKADHPIKRANALRIKSDQDLLNNNPLSRNNSTANKNDGPRTIPDLPSLSTSSAADSKDREDHHHLNFYDIHMATAHTIYDPSSSSYSNLHPSRRRHNRNKKRFDHSDNPNKGRDLYADLVIVFKFKSPPRLNQSKSLLKRQGSSSSLLDSPLSSTSPPRSTSSSFSATFSSSSPLATLESRIELEQQTMDGYEDILAKLTQVGLQYETSIHDWLTGVKVADTAEAEQMLQPAKVRDRSLDDLTDGSRLRLIHSLITGLPSEGGAGIYPGETPFVDGILPLHDRDFNKSWLKSWSTKWFLNHDDLSRIRDHFGEKVAYYFEFLEFYFLWLIIPTALGAVVHFFWSSFSAFYSVCVILWSSIFIESWKRRERELALWWGVKNVTKSESRRPSFKGDTIVIDPVTGEPTAFFSPWKRWGRKMAGLPVVVGGAFALSMVLTVVFGLEVFLEVYYDGYMKEVLVYLPTVLYTLAMPYVEELCNSVSKRLTDYENYETHGSYDYHLVQKVFVFKVLNSYLSILLTAYVYIPFGPHVISILQGYGLPFSTVAIEPKMLQDRLQAFMISNQLTSFFTETIYPWMSRRVVTSAAKIQKEVSEVLNHDDHVDEVEELEEDKQDPEEVKAFLKSVQDQVDLPEYDVNEDYGEMVEQFGYVSLFSVIWPLTGLCAFINNWIELRSDAAKICFHTRRPIPSRTDTIGPWIDNMRHLTWFSSLTNASILYMFRGSLDHVTSKGAAHVVDSSSPLITLVTEVGSRLSLSMMLLCLLASEHAYLALQWAVKTILESIPTDAEILVRKKEYGVTRSWLTRLNDVIGSDLSDVIAPAEGDAELTSKGRDRDDEVKRRDQAKLLETDLGAQAIRSVFKCS
ncbi:hypothetical protein BGZ83_007469 [Gryganskiella cystojenkinii]|nr:hypothetical protein BGZ83_007469 [Gryganskiella cystojenkinii]